MASSPKTPGSGGDDQLDFFGRAQVTVTTITTTKPAPAPTAPKPEPPKTYGVGELVKSAARMLEARFAGILVEGEISNLSAPRSGHVFFTLKDDEGQLPAVLFRAQAVRVAFRLADGMRVRARGRLSIFEGQGKFQLYVDALEPAGLGAAQLAFEALKQKLAAEGLFAAARKRPLPVWPRTVGVVTSPTGAVVRDIIRVAERRGRVRILIAPCVVQGPSAASSIIAALARIARRPGVDVVILARGGGSSEDLAAFNDEGLARAIARCPVPVVSAVGHEVDFTIADFVADQRAPTPSVAAELTVPLLDEAVARLREAEQRLVRVGRRRIEEARLSLDHQLQRARAALQQSIARRRRLLDVETRRLADVHPRARLLRDRAELLALRQRVTTSWDKALTGRRRAFGDAVAKLDALSPLAVLLRGYALVRDAKGHVVSDGAQVSVGAHVSVRLARGELDCRVDSIEMPAAAPSSKKPQEPT